MQGHEAHRAVKDLPSKATGMLEITNQCVMLPLLLSSPSLEAPGSDQREFLSSAQ